MGFFQDVGRVGSNITRQVSNTVMEYGRAVPIVGGVLVGGAKIQQGQLNALDKALGITKKPASEAEQTQLYLEQIQLNIEKQKEIADELKKEKRKKLLIYGFSGLGVILIATITYFIIKKRK